MDSIQKLIPIPEWPCDWQENSPYETPTVTVDVSPTTAWKADNFAMEVVITKDSTVFETITSTSTFEIPDLEPGSEYLLKFTPLNTDSDGEGSIMKGNPVEINFETAVPTPEYVEPPENMKAALSASDTSIRSHEFAKLIKDNIVDKGYKQMIFAFGQCFGGGMFKDLKDFDDTLLKSAAGWNETSWGNDGLGYDYWLEELRKEFESGDTIAKADHDAHMNDRRGPHGDRDNPPGTEHPQGLYNGDQNMRLTDDASSKHALLFSGSDEQRHKGDIEKWKTTLTSTPLGFDVISVVGGTKEDLKAALASISSQMNSNEVFLFMSPGHGSEATEIAEQVDVCPVEGGGVEFTPTTEILDIAQDSGLENLYIEFDVMDGWDIPYKVYLDELLIGISNPEVARNALPVAFEMIYWEDFNYLYFNPLEPCADSRMIHDIYLGTGAVPTVNDE
ncbi:MAG: C13 family peptidase [Thermotogota bacterium]|nr:C13 family peptidase [Thermotogota bacterium]